MSIFKYLFGDKNGLPEEKQREMALALFLEAETLTLDNPKKALATLRRKSQPLYDVLRIGGSLHREFRALVEKTQEHLCQCERLPTSTVEVICWDTWKCPTVRDLSEKAQITQADILYAAAGVSPKCHGRTGGAPTVCSARNSDGHDR